MLFRKSACDSQEDTAVSCRWFSNGNKENDCLLSLCCFTMVGFIGCIRYWCHFNHIAMVSKMIVKVNINYTGTILLDSYHGNTND